MTSDWRPCASREVLQLRARLLSDIRGFFADRAVLEVETPVLSRAGATDPNLHSLSTRQLGCAGTDTLYLHTSPESPMKRLLAAGSGPIFQIARVFRDGERGHLHNPEFTLIEWYRPGFDHHALMGEVQALMSLVLETSGGDRLTYARAFERYAGFDPHAATVTELRQQARRLALNQSEDADADRDYYLDLILSHRVTPHLGWARPAFLYDFPESQAALARVREGRPPVAERFEVFVHGLELGNGFHELRDAVEQRRRFERDLDRRRSLGSRCLPMDERLLAALEHGLPDCAGVALGFDRLVMIRAGAGEIDEVLAFPIERA